MDQQLLEHLLYEEESDSLDFKSQQYRFVGATDEDKSELLKDILAFANSWCREDAFILIGVQEVKGDKSIVTGVADHLDDADLQEFVNKKTQKPISFSYRAFNTPDGSIGIIQIPRQPRPFYLRKNFGKLVKETVYVRRGSSTHIATPDEIAHMGRDFLSKATPSLDLNFADPDSGTILGKIVTANTRILQYDPDTIPLYGASNNLFGIAVPFENRDNREFYREYVAYVRDKEYLSGFNISIRNTGPTLLSNVRIKMTWKKETALEIVDDADFPNEPRRRDIGYFMPNISIPTHVSKRRSASVNTSSETVTIISEMRDIQPKDEVFSDDPIFFGGSEPGEIRLSATVYADNLPEPLNFDLVVSVEPEVVQLDIKGFLATLDDED